MHPLDRLLGLLVPRRSLFRDGWGDGDLLGALDLAGLAAPPSPAEVAWGAARREGGLLVQDGRFESPERRLPPAVRGARVRRLRPAAGGPRGTVLLLAASGDQGYAARTLLARPLVARGLTALLLENPYYGSRRPPGQRGFAVRTVADFALMAFAAVTEAKALLAAARAEGAGPVGVAGYSMGGNLAAVVAAALPFEVAAVPMAPSATPAPVFTEGVLRACPDLAALANDGEGGEAARARLRAFLAAFDATRLPAPRAPRAAIVVGTRADGFVPPSEMSRLAAHWGCELRWLDAGHATAYVLRRAALRGAVVDAMGRLAGR